MTTLTRNSGIQQLHSGARGEGVCRTLTGLGQQFLSYIQTEVQKFVANKRITEANIRDLDQKIQMESYIREKKEAILEDRKNEKQLDSLNLNS